MQEANAPDEIGATEEDKDKEKKLTVNGRISMRKVIERQPSFETPLNKGINFLVIKWEAADAMPEIVQLLMEAGNAGHFVARSLTEVQTCMQIQQRASYMGQEITWEKIEKDLIESREDCKELIPKLVSFVKKYAGGKDSPMLKQLDDFSKQLIVKRRLPSSFFQALVKADLHFAMLYVNAMVKASLACPPKYVKENDTAMLLSPSDIMAAANINMKKPLVQDANDIMAQAHAR
jgi:hypothetical protein